MKTPLIAAAMAVLAGMLATAPQATAEPRVSIGHSSLLVTGRASCGCPTYSMRVCTGYDRRQHPTFDSYRQPFVCGCAGDHRDAVRKFHERRANEYRNHQERLHKVHLDYQKDLDKVYDKHRREIRDIERERNPRKYRERRANEERNHRERLRKVEDDYRRDLAKIHDKHQRELDDQYRDLLRATR